MISFLRNFYLQIVGGLSTIGMKKSSFFLLFFLLLIFGCHTTKKLAKNQNISFIYNPGTSVMHPQFSVFHSNDSISLLFFRVSKNEIKFFRSAETKVYSGKLKLHYVLFNTFEKADVLDSSTMIFNIETTDLNHFFSSQVPFKVKAGGKYSLYISITDMQTQNIIRSFLHVDKSSIYTSQNFLISSKRENELNYNGIINNKDTFQVFCNRLKLKKIYVSYYRNHFPMPVQPFSINNPKPLVFKADSTWTVNMTDSTFFNMQKKGCYHFRADSIIQDGLTLFYFNNSFPIVSTPMELLNPLQYLCSSREWTDMTTSENKKESVDDFWLKISGNTDRAKELIRVYYNRVILANKFFTSYTEGWKTDRGMIYIILGLPSTIYKTDGGERWIYGKNENMGEMVFDFIKEENLLSNNDFILQHSENYKNVWYLAVETWRDGRVYSVAN